jgi:hypothetical protein
LKYIKFSYYFTDKLNEKMDESINLVDMKKEMKEFLCNLYVFITNEDEKDIDYYFDLAFNNFYHDDYHKKKNVFVCLCYICALKKVNEYRYFSSRLKKCIDEWNLQPSINVIMRYFDRLEIKKS